MDTVIVESPYRGDVAMNLHYLRKCILDCLCRGEAPFASHAIYTPMLNDRIPNDRELGIKAGFAWRHAADRTVVYLDLGISPGMFRGIQHAQAIGHSVEYRQLGSGWL